MNTFEYVQLFDIVAVVAVALLVYNLMVAAASVIIFHALATGNQAARVDVKLNVIVAACCAALIYWHLVIPCPT